MDCFLHRTTYIYYRPSFYFIGNMALNAQNRRKWQRHKFTDTAIITPKGISQLINISSGGISFRCRGEQCLSKRWQVDIVDSSGIHLHVFPVEKVWESVEDKKGYSPIFTTTVGVKFKRLSLRQLSALYHFLCR